MEKQCRKCERSLPLESFYVHKQMADGHLNICKECTKKRVGRHREANLEDVKAYDRARNSDDRRAQNRANYRKRISTPEGRKREWARQQEYNRRGRTKKLVRALTRRAILGGLLIPKPCKRCGNEKVHAHHEDYSKPLDVIWLCVDCHGERHKEINEERRNDSQ